MNETKINCDLDVQNAIKSLPKDDKNCAIYIRGEVEPDGEGYDCKNYTVIYGNPEVLCVALLNTITQDKMFRDLAFDAILNYFGENPEDAEEFIGHLKTVVDD